MKLDAAKSAGDGSLRGLGSGRTDREQGIEKMRRIGLLYVHYDKSIIIRL